MTHTEEPLGVPREIARWLGRAEATITAYVCEPVSKGHARADS